MGGQCTGRRNTKWGNLRVQSGPSEAPPAELTPGGASFPASLLRCLPVTPLCVLPRRDMTSRSIKGEKAIGRSDASLDTSPGEACPPSASVGPCAGDIRGKSIPMPLSAAEPTYSLRGGGRLAYQRGRLLGIPAVPLW